MKKTIVILTLFSTLLLGGCYYDVEEELYGTTPCNNSAVTYSGTITGILNSYGCVGCHSGGAPSGNVSLVDYNRVKAATSGGLLLGAVKHSPGISPMPQGGPKMNDCDISKIEAWINAGAPNN